MQIKKDPKLGRGQAACQWSLGQCLDRRWLCRGELYARAL